MRNERCHGKRETGGNGRKGLRRVGRTALALALALGLGGPSRAGDEVPLEGTGIVRAKSEADHSVTIGTAVYRVTEETRLLGPGGEKMTFAHIPVFTDGEGDSGYVRFEARGAGGTPELELLQVTMAPR